MADHGRHNHPISVSPNRPNSVRFQREFVPVTGYFIPTQPMRRFLIIAARTVLAVLSFAAVGLLAFAGWLVWHYDYDMGLPTEAQLAAIAPTGPACRTDPKRAYIPLVDIPPLLRDAAIAYEQPDFYEAWSLNPIAEIAFAVGTGRSPRPAGITQSVARCLLSLSPGTDRQIDPIASIFFMQRVTRNLSRDRILEIYLNESYRGRGAYGVAAGAEAYFGKPLPDIDVDEIAFITARARQPNPSRSFDTRSRDHVIDRMQTAGLISETQAAAAKSRLLLLKDTTGAQAQPVNQ
ncbi:transglycosylase domain-containing protein [Bradyrhizobium sp. CCGUVB23]|uniref:transglycosylase domain-containing protein n=1 Tax=Bradyrhizobium sp. CCGUVB23 TaxID=2949630 RepID=UPI0020B22182|nr:transglycosylase domain-containing protein [Bradyrhizobium sp. CCGUVB23]MCP3458878.1 transglycosylase domain-containing protein [Bradyrhizobium sp. CCGUVB23]